MTEAVQGNSFGSSEPAVPRPEWEKQFLAYLLFLEEKNRRPSQHAENPGERNLFYWHRHQISSLKNGLLLGVDNRTAAISAATQRRIIRAPGQ